MGTRAAFSIDIPSPDQHSGGSHEPESAFTENEGHIPTLPPGREDT